MKKNLLSQTCFLSRVLIVALATLVWVPINAHAVVQNVDTRIAVIADSSLDTSAHWINTVTAIHASCNGAIYIPFADKEMFAVALTAQANKLNVEIYYDTSASSITFPGYGNSSTCRAIAINLKYVA